MHLNRAANPPAPISSQHHLIITFSIASLPLSACRRIKGLSLGFGQIRSLTYYTKSSSLLTDNHNPSRVFFSGSSVIFSLRTNKSKMTSKLVPSDPAKVMVIRDVVPNIITTFSTPFWRFGRIKIGGRGTVGMHLSRH